MHEELTTVNIVQPESPTVPCAPRKRKPASVIIAEVGAAYQVSPEAIKGPSRNRTLVRARCEAMRRVSDEWEWLSYPAIGRMFNRDHSTVMHHLRKGNDGHTKKACTCDQGPKRAKKGGAK